MGILRFMDIRADAGSWSPDLVADDGFTLIFEKFDKIEYFNGECNRYVDTSLLLDFSIAAFSFRMVIADSNLSSIHVIDKFKTQIC